MADQNTGVERERIGTRIDEDLTGLESREERDRVGSFADTDRAPSRPRVTPPKASAPTAAPNSRTREIRAEIEQTREDLRDSQCHSGSPATVDAGCKRSGQREGCSSRATS